MRRIQVVIDPELDDRLEQEAAARRMSKSALVRECVEQGLPRARENGLLAVLELSKLAKDVDPVEDIDTFLYGPIGSDV